MSKELHKKVFSFADREVKECLSGIMGTAVRLKVPVAIWRLPLTDEIHLIIDLSGKTQKVKVDLEALSQGFAFAPFHSSDERPCDFISADLMFSSKDRQLKVNPIFKGSSDLIETFFNELSETETSGSHYHLGKLHPTEFNTSENDYEELVSHAVKTIKNSHLKKIVLSRVKSIDLHQSFDPLKLFMELAHAYPGAFVNLISLPGKGTWMGATPELLVSQDEQDIFRTVSLAGTQKAEPHSDPLEIAWTQKEIEEQALVGRYIINCFKKIRLREFEEDGPKTVKAANLYHLKSEYSVNTREVNFPQLATVMLELLHPTSAVCGMPKEESMKYILEHEGYDREYYAGYLGPVNIHQQSSLFVNLRCMQLFKNKANLYAGGGITEFSHPEKEWKETEMKCNTLLNIIHQSAE